MSLREQDVAPTPSSSSCLQCTTPTVNDTSLGLSIQTPLADDCSICKGSSSSSSSSSSSRRNSGGALDSPTGTLNGSPTFYFAAVDDGSDTESSTASGSSTPLHPGNGKLKGYGATSSSASVVEAGSPIEPARTPLPLKQITVLLIAQLPEPVVATVILPFINQLILELGITGGDDKKVGYYAGIVESMFFFCEFCCILHWGRLSDRIGRKPVILCGLAGLTLSITSFGLSRTYLTLIISRALAGVLSGNVGVFKCMMAEITDETNIAEGYSMMPVVWSVGSTLGPMLGGFLSHPQDKWPQLFSANFWNTYPYFLPCASAAAVCLVSWCLVAHYLEESLPSLAPKKKIFDDKDEFAPLLIEARPNITRQSSEDTLVNVPPPPPALRDILTRRVVIAIANYCFISLIDIAYFALIPLFYATPVEDGGLGLSPSMIGTFLAILGVINGIIQSTLTAKAQRRFGVKFVFMFGLCTYFPIWASFPAMSMAARASPGELPWSVYGLMSIQLLLIPFVSASFGCTFLFINSAAERSSLGATNGVAQTSVSLIRTIGPTIATCLFAVSVENNLLGGHLVYCIMLVLTVGAVMVGTYLPSRVL